jgi:hypothetical protein
MLPRHRTTIAGGRPRVVAACASANARPTTRVLGGACSPRTLEPRRSPADARMHSEGWLHPATPSRLLLEFPSIGAPCRLSTPSALSKQGTFGPAVPSARVAFHPRGFSPPRRFSPAVRCGHCCSPLPILGFVAFRDRADWFGAPEGGVPAGVGVPRDAFTPRRCSLSAVLAPSPRESRRVSCTRSPRSAARSVVAVHRVR